MTEYSCKIQKPPREADHAGEASFSNGARGRRPGAGRHTPWTASAHPAGTWSQQLPRRVFAGAEKPV